MSTNGEFGQNILPILETEKGNLKNDRDYSSLSGTFIRTAKDFKNLVGIDDSHIKWKKQKSLYLFYNQYKHEVLEYSSYHLGFCLSFDETFHYIGYHSTFHGVCQGIAQLDE